MTYLSNSQKFDDEMKENMGLAIIELFGDNSKFGLNACFNHNFDSGFEHWDDVVFRVKDQEERRDDSASTADNNNEGAK